MPTDPLPSALQRDITRVEYKEMIDLACPLLQELVNDGTNVLQRCNVEVSKGERDVNVAPLVLYRHIVEATDGVEVLLQQASVTPTIPIIRSSFEAGLQLEYMVSEGPKYRERSLSWILTSIHQRLKFYSLVTRSSQEAEEFHTALEQRFPALKPKIDARAAQAASETDKLMSLLQEAHLQPIEAEHQLRNRPKNWYTLFGGQPNLRALAKHLKRLAEYDVLYRQFSRLAHGTEMQRYIEQIGPEAAGIRQLRGSTDFLTLAGITASCALRAKRLMLKQFRPDENYSAWYIREVRQRYLQVVGSEAVEP